MKFAINKDGSYSHYGTDGTIDFNDEWNEDNQPFNHKYIKGKWVINKKAQKRDDLLKLYEKCDLIKIKLEKNETYSYDDTYKDVKMDLLNELKDNRLLIKELKG